MRGVAKHVKPAFNTNVDFCQTMFACISSLFWVEESSSKQMNKVFLKTCLQYTFGCNYTTTRLVQAKIENEIFASAITFGKRKTSSWKNWRMEFSHWPFLTCDLWAWLFLWCLPKRGELIVAVGCTKFLLQDFLTHPSHWQFTSIYMQVLFPSAK